VFHSFLHFIHSFSAPSLLYTSASIGHDFSLACGQGSVTTLRPELNILQLVLTRYPLSRNQTRHRLTIIGNSAVSRELQLPINVITMLTAVYRRHSRPVQRNICPLRLHRSRNQTDRRWKESDGSKLSFLGL
jgi:hypothetical protein